MRMSREIVPDAPAAPRRERLFVYNGGFLWRARTLRRILDLAGYDLRIGLPEPDDLVAVWGQSPTAGRGEAIAERRGARLLRVEDAFLRSLHPGRSGEPPSGLLLDRSGLHLDPRRPSDLETLLTTHPLDDTALLDRAREAIARLRDAHLTKYSATDPAIAPPQPGYVLVIDQTRGDASVTVTRGGRADFLEMLAVAQEEHPGSRILIKTHPETRQGHRVGHFNPGDTTDRVALLTAPVSPWHLMDGAVGVYTYASQMGFEAILAGHRPRVFGQPFYAGWGLSADERPVARRNRRLTAAQLFAAAMILAPTWYDPHRDRLCALEDVIDTLEARTRAWRDDRDGWTAAGMRLWKRPHIQKMFGHVTPVTFRDRPVQGRRHMAWGAKAEPQTMRVEDGFLRSRGLGAALVPPLSLVLDDLGLHYDPSAPSRLEALLNEAPKLRPEALRRAARLRRAILRARLSKYNLAEADAPAPALPDGHRILVVGQVEDDAAIRLGTTSVRTNRDLLRTARAANPDARLLYKPHPDVEAGLRRGAVPDAGDIADAVLTHTDPMALLEEVQEVWTMTSLLGFEALLRDVPVTTLGVPFYAGWGLTRDLADTPPRRTAKLTLDQLVHASLIAYPRYFDPVTGTACPPEVIVHRLSEGGLPKPGIGHRLLGKAQGLLASHADLWR